MSMDAQQQQIFSLMAIAEDQQKAVQAALDELAQAAASVAGLATEVRTEVRKAAAEAVGASVRQSLAGASDAAAKALADATAPVLGSLSGVVKAAREAEGSMRNAGKWFAWKWIAVAAGGAAGVCLVAYAALAWQLQQVSSLQKEKAALQADIAQMQANAAALERKGGRIVITTCGGRLCVQASSNQGKAERWDGALWRDEKTGALFVIPAGY